jgi:hypothetical protein
MSRENSIADPILELKSFSHGHDDEENVSESQIIKAAQAILKKAEEIVGDQEDQEDQDKQIVKSAFDKLQELLQSISKVNTVKGASAASSSAVASTQAVLLPEDEKSPASHKSSPEDNDLQNSAEKLGKALLDYEFVTKAKESPEKINEQKINELLELIVKIKKADDVYQNDSKIKINALKQACHIKKTDHSVGVKIDIAFFLVLNSMLFAKTNIFAKPDPAGKELIEKAMDEIAKKDGVAKFIGKKMQEKADDFKIYFQYLAQSNPYKFMEIFADKISPAMVEENKAELPAEDQNIGIIEFAKKCSERSYLNEFFEIYYGLLKYQNDKNAIEEFFRNVVNLDNLEKFAKTYAALPDNNSCKKSLTDILEKNAESIVSSIIPDKNVYQEYLAEYFDTSAGNVVDLVKILAKIVIASNSKNLYSNIKEKFDYLRKEHETVSFFGSNTPKQDFEKKLEKIFQKFNDDVAVIGHQHSSVFAALLPDSKTTAAFHNGARVSEKLPVFNQKYYLTSQPIQQSLFICSLAGFLSQCSDEMVQSIGKKQKLVLAQIRANKIKVEIDSQLSKLKESLEVIDEDQFANHKIVSRIASLTHELELMASSLGAKVPKKERKLKYGSTGFFGQNTDVIDEDIKTLQDLVFGDDAERIRAAFGFGQVVDVLIKPTGQMVEMVGDQTELRYKKSKELIKAAAIIAKDQVKALNGNLDNEELNDKEKKLNDTLEKYTNMANSWVLFKKYDDEVVKEQKGQLDILESESSKLLADAKGFAGRNKNIKSSRDAQKAKEALKKQLINDIKEFFTLAEKLSFMHLAIMNKDDLNRNLSFVQFGKPIQEVQNENDPLHNRYKLNDLILEAAGKPIQCGKLSSITYIADDAARQQQPETEAAAADTAPTHNFVSRVATRRRISRGAPAKVPTFSSGLPRRHASAPAASASADGTIVDHFNSLIKAPNTTFASGLVLQPSALRPAASDYKTIVDHFDSLSSDKTPPRR